MVVQHRMFLRISRKNGIMYNTAKASTLNSLKCTKFMASQTITPHSTNAL